jgi:hypothetical protein
MQKRGHFTTVKIKKYLSLYLYRCKKGAKKQHPDKKILKIFPLYLISMKKEAKK